MPYTSGIGFRSWHADHPSFKRLGAGTPSRFALVFTSAIERVPKQNRPILSRACPRVSKRILAKKRVSEFPNNWGAFTTLYGMLTSANGAMVASSQVPTLLEAQPTGGTSYEALNYSADRVNSIYGNSNTVQPSAVRALVLIRAF